MRLGTSELAILTLPLLLVYFIPTIVALSRKKTNRASIFLLNLLLGWTFVGWVVALIWSFSTDNKQTVIVNNHQSNSNTPTPSPTPKTEKSTTDFDEKVKKLQKLKELADSGILSQQEFEEQKAQVLSS